MVEQVLIRITGKVQGVFYRAHAKKNAEALNLKGYAKNMPDGSVEILVQGDMASIESLISWCRKGSPSAKVEKVETSWQKASAQTENFKII